MTVELWRGSDARWRWRYVEPGTPVDGRPLVLWANKHYASRDEALRSATTAYPDVPVRARAAPPRRRRWPRWLLGAALLAAVMAGRRRRR